MKRENLLKELKILSSDCNNLAKNLVKKYDKSAFEIEKNIQDYKKLSMCAEILNDLKFRIASENLYDKSKNFIFRQLSKFSAKCIADRICQRNIVNKVRKLDFYNVEAETLNRKVKDEIVKIREIYLEISEKEKIL